MDSVFGRFIVDINRDAYNREIELNGGGVLYVDPTYRPTHYAKQEGVVYASPRGSRVGRGDRLFFHYTVVEMEGSVAFIDDDTRCLVPEDSVFFVKRSDSSIWESFNGHVAVVPYKLPEKLSGGLKLRPEGLVSEKQGTVLVHPNPEMVGQKVTFHPRNAFENRLDMKSVYVMSEEDIDATLVDWLEE
jgi:hypothetical protein